MTAVHRMGWHCDLDHRTPYDRANHPTPTNHRSETRGKFTPDDGPSAKMNS